MAPQVVAMREQTPDGLHARRLRRCPRVCSFYEALT